MSAALHLPHAAPPLDMARLLAAWAERADWSRVRHVVYVGDPVVEPWAILRAHRADLRTVVYSPGATPRVVDAQTHVVAQPVELHAVIAGAFHSRDRLEITGEPRYRDLMAEVRTIVDGAIDYALAQEITTRQRSASWIELGLRLLPHMVERPMVQTLPRAWEGRPAIVVGAGPSLDHDLDALRGLRDRAIIIAASSAAGPLARGGVQPHAWVCAETSDHASTELRERGTHEGAYLVPGSHCHEGFWKLSSLGVVPLVQVTVGVGTMLGRRCGVEVIGSGSSVTTLCYAVARALGADPIVLVGQDCGYRDDLQVYAEGRSEDFCGRATAHAAELREQGHLSRVPAWGGFGHVLATPTLTIFRQFFEVRAVDREEPTIVNASSRGARIAHTVELRLDDIDIPVPPSSPADALDIAVAAAPRLDRESVRVALRAELESLAPYRERASEATAAAAALVDAMDDVKRLGLDAGLCASYAVPPVDEVQSVLPRHGVVALQSISGRIAESAPRLEDHIRDALARLEDSP